MNTTCSRCGENNHDIYECVLASSARDKNNEPIPVNPNDRFMNSKVDTRFIYEQATELWQLTASYLCPRDIGRLACCNKYLNDEVVWGKYSHALLWRETDLEKRYPCLSNMLTFKTILERSCHFQAPFKQIAILVKAGAKITNEAFYLACHYENVVKLFLDNKANPDIADTFGCSPLIFASNKGNERTVNLLLSRNANVNHQDNSGNTALTCACLKGYVYIARMLIRAGANINRQNLEGHSPLSIVRERRYGIPPHRPVPEEMLIKWYQQMLDVVEGGQA